MKGKGRERVRERVRKFGEQFVQDEWDPWGENVHIVSSKTPLLVASARINRWRKSDGFPLSSKE